MLLIEELPKMDHDPISHGKKVLLAERINRLVKALSDGVYEREDTIKLCLLAALAGESVFLLGPPGIAKSLIAKRLIQAFDNSSYFEYLMTRFSTPEEVFGPLSIQELKDNGRYVRLTEGYLPSAQVVFLDEIWKAGPAILNTLLTVVNEKTFKNGNDIEKVPMRLLISASNELPDENSGLEALYDRMLVRIFVNRIQSKNNFKSMLTVGTPQEIEIPVGLAITDDEYHLWQRELNQLSLPTPCFDKLYQLKTMLEAEVGSQCNESLYISDRRWKKAVKLLKASAYFNGRAEINPLDLLLLQECLWNSSDSYQYLHKTMQYFATDVIFDQQAIAQNIDQFLEEFGVIQTEIELQFRVSLTIDKESKLRRKELYQYDLSKTKRYQVGLTSNLVKMVLLQSNKPVAEIEDSDSYWVYLDKDELEKVLKNGGGFAYGYVNDNPNLCRLTFALDSNDNLVIKDMANRSILVGMVMQKELEVALHQSWCDLAEEAMRYLMLATEQLEQARAHFYAALPHHFIAPQFPTMIETSLQLLAKRVEAVQTESNKNLYRIKHLNHFFS